VGELSKVENVHSQNFYDTPENIKRVLIDKLFLGTNLYFVMGYVNVILKASGQFKKGNYGRKGWEQSSLDIMKHIEKCGGKFHVSGIENLKKCEGPLVVVGNHMSVLETFALPYFVSPIHKATYIIKDTLTTRPVFGNVMKSIDPIEVGRKNPREDLKKVMEEGKEKLKNGISIMVFPQNTRKEEFIPEDFNTIGIKLAKAAGVKILPVALKTDFWANGKVIKDYGKISREKPIYFKFGEALDITGNGKAEHKKIVNFIKENLDKWNNE
jgi:1-acyl-sn-glycerol-3-phosphate acyltransferase